VTEHQLGGCVFLYISAPPQRIYQLYLAIVKFGRLEASGNAPSLLARCRVNLLS